MVPYSDKYTNASGISQTSFATLPAVALGGPPHSGKSVLAYSLTQALRARDVPHYLLRAYPPDYEGDWFFVAEPETVRHLRLKGASSAAWLPLLQRDIAARHLPLLVDVGGLPTPEQETLLDACTHGVLLTPDAASRELWRERFERHGLALLADLRSDLHGVNALAGSGAPLEGTLAGLERGRMAEGPAFEALVERLAALFNAAMPGLLRQHLLTAPAELAVDVTSLARQLGQDPRGWLPEALPAVLEYLPEHTPLALYGRGPNWLYAAVAAHAWPAAFYLFDVRCGWVQAPALPWGTPTEALRVAVQRGETAVQLDFLLPESYLDLAAAATLPIPPVTAPGLILNGKLPHWLWSALVRQYQHCAWLAVAHPQMGGAVIVRSAIEERPVGACVALLQK